MMPLVRDPRSIARLNPARRYHARVVNGGLWEHKKETLAMYEQWGRLKMPDLLNYAEPLKREWLAGQLDRLCVVLDRYRRNFEKMSAEHPIEARTVAGAFRSLSSAYRDLMHGVAIFVQHIKTEAEDGWIDEGRIYESFDYIIKACQPWPRAIAAINTGRRDRLQGGMYKVDSAIEEVQKKVLASMRMYDSYYLFTGGQFDKVQAGLLEDMYHDAEGEAMREELEGFRAEFQKAAAGDLDYLIWQVFRMDMWLYGLEYDAALSELMAAGAEELKSPSQFSNAPLGGAGVLFLGNDGNRAPRFYEGGGGVMVTNDLSMRYHPFRIKKWYKDGDRVVLVYPSKSGFPNVEQVNTYMEDSFFIHKMLPGNPDVCFGVASRSGALRIYGLDGKDSWDAAWDGLTDKVFGVMAGYRRLQKNITDRCLFATPDMRDYDTDDDPGAEEDPAPVTARMRAVAGRARRRGPAELPGPDLRAARCLLSGVFQKRVSLRHLGKSIRL